jgi:hypothetical protein
MSTVKKASCDLATAEIYIYYGWKVIVTLFTVLIVLYITAKARFSANLI